MHDTNYTRVSDEIRFLIHKAIRRVCKREIISSELQDAFAGASTLDELAEAIRKAKNNSAAGLNGVSYNMLKQIPAGIIANIHSCLLRVWERKGTLVG